MPPAGWTTLYLPGAMLACCGGSARARSSGCAGGTGGLALRGPRAQSLLAELQQDRRALCSVTDFLGDTGQAQASLCATAKPDVIWCSGHGSFPSAERRWESADKCLPRFLRWRMVQESKTRSPNGVQGKEIRYSHV